MAGVLNPPAHMAAGEADGALVDHVGEGGPLSTQVRGSLIASSLQSLREFGYFDRYQQHLAPQHRDAVLYCIASSWLPMEVAAAHYAACDAMQLSDAQLGQVGEAVSTRIMGTFLGTMMRRARTFGAAPTPWTPLKQYGRICDRILLGGHHLVHQVGPKDALVETRGLPLFGYRYFRTAMVGMARGAAGMFAKTCYAREVRQPDLDCVRVSLRWV